MDLEGDVGNGFFTGRLEGLAQEDLGEARGAVVELLEFLELVRREAGEAALSSEEPSEDRREVEERPLARGDSLSVVDAAGAPPELLLVLAAEELDIVVPGLGDSGWRPGRLSLLAVVEDALCEVLL